MGFFHTIFLFDGFRSVRASLFGNTLRGGAPAGAGKRIATPVCGLARNDRLFSTACVTAKGRDTALCTRGRLWDSAPAGAGKRIPTPVCGLARNDTADAVFGRTGSSAPTDGHKGCGGKTAGRCTPRVLVPLRSTAWASPPTEGSKGCGAKQEFGYRFLAGDVVQWRQGIPGKEFPLCWIFLTYSGR